MSGARALAAKRPGVRRLVSQGLFLLNRRQVRGDRDAVRRAVDDLTARELAAGQPDPRRIQSEPRGQAIVEPLQPRPVVVLLERKESRRRI
jgi:hypothetical protein